MAKTKGTRSVDTLEKANAAFDKYEKVISTAGDLAESYVRSGCIPMDLLTKGKGVALGKFWHFYSQNGLGKSTSFMTLAKYLCCSGKKVLWAAAEPGETLAYSIGLVGDNKVVPEGSFRYIDLAFYSELDEITYSFLNSEYDFLFIDSLTAVTRTPDVADQNKENQKDIEKSLPGIQSRLQSNYFWNYQSVLKRYPKTIFYVTQTRYKIDLKAAPNAPTEPKPAGGEATMFYSDLRFAGRGDTRIEPKEVGMDGGGFSGKTGYIMAEKNRHAPPFVKIPICIIYGKGLSNVYSMQNFLYWDGVITSGAGGHYKTLWKQEEKSHHGKAALYSWIRENMSGFMDYFYDKVEDYFDYLQSVS